METKTTFSKADIIRIIEDDPELEYFNTDYRSTEKRLNTILQFLQKKETIKAFKQGNQPDFWIDKEMTLFNSTLTNYKYEYNTVDTVFLIVLVSCFEDPYFKWLRESKNIKNPHDESQTFIDSFSTEFNNWMAVLMDKLKFKIDEIEDEKDEETKKDQANDEKEVKAKKDEAKEEKEKKEKQIGKIKVNFISMLHQLSISPLAMKYTKEIEDKLNSLLILFFSLKDADKIEVYEGFMKSRVDTIAERMDKFTDGLKKDDPEGYFELKQNIKLDYKPILNEEINNALKKLYES